MIDPGYCSAQEPNVDPNWNELIETEGPIVYRIAWRILGHAQDAEDTVQDVFLELHRRWPEQRWRDAIAILRRIAVCRALDRLRQRRRTAAAAELDVTEQAPGPSQLAAAHELGQQLRDAIGQLPAREAEIFCL